MSAIFLFGVSAALHFYIGARLEPELPAPWSVLLTAWLAVSTVLMPMGMLAWRFIRGKWAERVAVAGLFAMGLFSSLLVATFLRDVALIALGIVHVEWPRLYSYERLEFVSAAVVPLIAITVTLIG